MPVYRYGKQTPTCTIEAFAVDYSLRSGVFGACKLINIKSVKIEDGISSQILNT